MYRTISKALISLTANMAVRILKREFVGEISGLQMFFNVEARVFPRNLAAFFVTDSVLRPPGSSKSLFIFFNRALLRIVILIIIFFRKIQAYVHSFCHVALK